MTVDNVILVQSSPVILDHITSIYDIVFILGANRVQISDYLTNLQAIS